MLYLCSTVVEVDVSTPQIDPPYCSVRQVTVSADALGAATKAVTINSIVISFFIFFCLSPGYRFNDGGMIADPDQYVNHYRTISNSRQLHH